MRERIKQVISIIGMLAWRGFGVFLFILGGAAGSGAVITGSPLTGILIAWVTLMLVIIGAIGYAIAVTGEVTEEHVAKATKDAIQRHVEETKK